MPQTTHFMYGTTSTYRADAFTGVGLTNEAKITAAIAAAVADGVQSVFVPQSMLPYNASLVTFNTAVRMIREGGDPSEFDVEAYGATPGFATLSTVSIQAALDAQSAVKRGTVRLPGIGYLVTTLNFYTGTILCGNGIQTSGSGGTQLLQQSGTATPILQPASPSGITSAFRLEDFVASASGNASNTGGIDCTSCFAFSINRVAVSSCGVYGFRFVGGTVAGNAGFGHLTECQVQSQLAGAYSFIISSSVNDQPDGLTFTNCYVSSTLGTWIRYQTNTHTGPQNVWNGCSFECSGGNATTDISFDATGAGPVSFSNCRFENTGTGGIQVTLNGWGIQPAAYFDQCDFAPGSGGLTWVDNGPVTSPIANTAWGTTPSAIVTKFLGIRTAIKTITAATYSVQQNDCVVLVDATAQPITITLPNAGALPGTQAGSIFRVIKTDASANSVTVASGSGTINGSASKILSARYQSMDVQTDGTNYFVIATHGISLMTASPDFSMRLGGSLMFPDSTQYFQGASAQFNWTINSTVQLGLIAGLLRPNAAGGIALGSTALPFSAIVSAQTNLGTGASFTPNAALGSSFIGTANAATTWNAPTNPSTGQRITCTTIQDGTGGRTVAWNAVFKVSWSDTGNTLGKRSSVSFVYDGTNWNQDGAQTPYI